MREVAEGVFVVNVYYADDPSYPEMLLDGKGYRSREKAQEVSDKLNNEQKKDPYSTLRSRVDLIEVVD